MNLALYYQIIFSVGLAGASVAMDSSSVTTTAEDGSFTFAHVDSGDHVITVTLVCFFDLM